MAARDVPVKNELKWLPAAALLLLPMDWFEGCVTVAEAEGGGASHFSERVMGEKGG